jgi:acyl-coenzyme A thioesterase PaaI-like protein
LSGSPEADRDEDDTPGAASVDGSGRRHVLSDLGWAIRRVGPELHGTALVVPEMHVPGARHLRTSILAVWADTLAGLLAAEVIGPRVPVTLELDVQLYRPPPADGTVQGVGMLVKSGRSVLVAGVDFAAGDGESFGFALASFMAAPDVTLRMASRTSVDRAVPTGPRLLVPFAERVGCTRREPGVAVLSPSDEALNASNTVNGGLLALAAEEAALSLAPGATLSSLGLRYLQPVRVGAAVAEARVRHGLGRVEIRDATDPDRVCVLATSRVFPA